MKRSFSNSRIVLFFKELSVVKHFSQAIHEIIRDHAYLFSMNDLKDDFFSNNAKRPNSKKKKKKKVIRMVGRGKMAWRKEE